MPMKSTTSFCLEQILTSRFSWSDAMLMRIVQSVMVLSLSVGCMSNVNFTFGQEFYHYQPYPYQHSPYIGGGYAGSGYGGYQPQLGYGNPVNIPPMYSQPNGYGYGNGFGYSQPPIVPSQSIYLGAPYSNPGYGSSHHSHHHPWHLGHFLLGN